MTVRVTVKTHGCPAAVSVDGADPVTVDHHQARTFDIDGSSTLSITEEEPSADHGAEMSAGEAATGLSATDVPGRAENDALLGKGKRKGEPPADLGDAQPGSSPAV